MTKYFFKHIQKMTGTLLLFSFSMVIIYATQLTIPYTFSDYLGTLSKGNVTITYTIILLLLTGLYLSSNYIIMLLETKLTNKASYSMINQLISHFERLPLNFTRNHQAAALNQRFTNDVLTLLDFFFSQVIPAIFMIMSSLIMAFMILSISVYIFLGVTVILLVNIICTFLLNKAYYKRGYQVRDVNINFYETTHHRLEAYKQTKRHSWYEIIGDKCQSSHLVYKKSSYKFAKIAGLLNNLADVSKYLSLVVIVLITSYAYSSGQLNIGQIILISTYTQLCIGNTTSLMKINQSYQHAKMCFDRIFEFLSQDVERDGQETLGSFEKIQIENLNFSFDDKNLYNDLNLTLNKGKIYCLRGDNGAGKSTLIDIITGLRFDYKGKILYNSKNIRNLSCRNLRRKAVSIIEQEPQLLNLSIDDNLNFGLDRPASTYRKRYDIDALSTKHYKDLSGGEKQRLAISRGLSKSADLLILDEPTSALDKVNIHKLKEDLVSLKQNKIILLITHQEEIIDIVDEFIAI